MGYAIINWSEVEQRWTECMKMAYTIAAQVLIHRRSLVSKLCMRRKIRICTCVGCVRTRWWGSRDLNRSPEIRARYAIPPLQVGSISAVKSAASDQLFSDCAHRAFSPKSERRTADFRPSAPTRTSQNACVPSSKRRLTGPPSRCE